MLVSSRLSFPLSSPFICTRFPACSTPGTLFFQKKILLSSSNCRLESDRYAQICRIIFMRCTFRDPFVRKLPCIARAQQDQLLQNDKKSNRRLVLLLLISSVYPTLSSDAKTRVNNPYDEKRLLEQNRRVQRENNVPEEFPNFVREGFEVKVKTSENYVKRESGLIYWDIEGGKGDCPKDGQQVTFHYVGYNESGRRIDSTYLQGAPAKIRMGTNALVPGFEEGIRDMRPGGKRRIIIPPELGPPVGPSTFFSSKQFEVFDVELLSVQNCERRTIGFYSDVVCN